MQKELARPFRRVVVASGLHVFRDVGIDQPDLAVAGIGIGFRNRCLTGAQRLHLAAGERNAGLESLSDLVIESRLAIVRDNLAAGARFLSAIVVFADRRAVVGGAS